MPDDFIADKNFDKTFSFAKAEYDNCTFDSCNFSEADLSSSSFSDCTFTECNFAMAKISHTGFRDVTFKSCKLLGLHFEHCDAFLFAAHFQNCTLNLASFYRMKIRKMKFESCSMHETDFTETDLTGAQFNDCDLLNATFDNTILEMADLRTAFNYSIDPAANYIRKAKFSLAGIPGLLARHDIVIEP
jgi:uncharacterized protein YjbI with pentapeptide repeats